ncbi:hypothetical protein L1765_11210 [Microaerobacter geothermalis]|uniref:hypothetical protein n=1 Tax=Microaerobacter geothermalis TaxID=674972 RepID=UPI001F389AF8|nr:hypothetical protein [Microaerobacter geothermalis]MCF6094531.1 hypothetical protein [Microaerobacter geothermalis]
MSRVEEIMNQIYSLSVDELKELNEKFLEYLEQKGWTIISEATFEDNEEDDIYST